jgi:hypothetical protein
MTRCTAEGEQLAAIRRLAEDAKEDGGMVAPVHILSLLDAAAADDCSGCSMPGGRHWDTCPNRCDGRPTR